MSGLVLLVELHFVLLVDVGNQIGHNVFACLQSLVLFLFALSIHTHKKRVNL